MTKLILLFFCISLTVTAQIDPRFYKRNKSVLPLGSGSGAVPQKRTEAIKQKLDSIVCGKVLKSEYLYDNDGHNIEEFSRTWDNNQNLISSLKNQYDNKGRTILSISYNKDTVTGKWIGLDNRKSSFNENGDEIYWIYQWDSSSEKWLEYFKIDRFYDSVNRVKEEKFNYWDIDSNIYVRSGINKQTWNDQGELLNIHSESFNKNGLYYGDDISYTYDESGNEIYTLRTVYEVQNNEWIDDSKSESTYENGNRILYTSSQWFEALKMWIFSYRSRSTYTSEGYVKTVIDSVYDTSTFLPVLLPKTKMEYEHDAKGNTISWITYTWDEGKNDWSYTTKSEYDYDELGNGTMESYYKWNFISRQWIGDYRVQFIFDTNILISELSIPKSTDTTYLKSKVKSVIYYKWNNGWEKNPQYVYYYSDQILTNITDSDIGTSGIRMYPNPASDQIKIQIDNATATYSAELYDMEGRRVLNKSFTNLATLNINQLARGIYHYRVSDNEKSWSGKIAKE